jgi:hypothetical protein
VSSDAAPRWRDLSPGWATPAVAALCVAAFGGLLFLTRRFDFYFDEWDFVLGAPHWTLSDYLQPHNEHWSTVPAVIYRALFAAVGARSYLPFMAVLLAMHAGIAFLLYLLVRRRQGAALGLLAAATMLFLGRGWEDILWAFQISFLGSVLFGLGAWVLLDRPSPSPLRPAAAALLLLLAVMSSGIGLFFLAATAVELLLDGRRRSWLAAVVPAAAAYAAWFLLIGRTHSAVHRSPYSLEAVRSLVTFVPFGIGAAMAGLFGVAIRYSQAGLAALALLVGAAWGPPRARPSPRALAAAVGLLAEFGLIGLVRAQFGDQEAGSPRYIYIAAVFLLILLAEAVGGLPWRGAWGLGLVLVAALAVAWSGYHLLQAVAARDTTFARQRAELQTLWAVRDAPDLNRKAIVDPDLMPQVSVQAYFDSRAIQGSTAPETGPGGLRSLPADAVDRELVQVLRFDIVDTSAPISGSGCANVDTSLGYMDVSAGEGQTVTIASRFPGPARIFAWVFAPAPPAERPVATVEVPPAERLRVVIPRTGQGLVWHVRIYPPPYGDAMACVSG